MCFKSKKILEELNLEINSGIEDADETLGEVELSLEELPKLIDEKLQNYQKIIPIKN